MLVGHGFYFKSHNKKTFFSPFRIEFQFAIKFKPSSCMQNFKETILLKTDITENTLDAMA